MSRKFEDLTGQRFGKLVVLFRTENKIESNGRKRVMWHCKCDCGNETDVSGSSLKSNHTNSCGCLKHKHLHPKKADDKFKNLSGLSFNNLTVLYKVNTDERETSNTLWKCVCICGNETTLRANQIVNGFVKSCGCLKIQNTKNALIKDLKGQRFGKLLVIRQKCSTNKGVIWECVCGCGSKVDVLGTRLINGVTKSCGCLQKEKIKSLKFQDLTGEKFGMLTVLHREGYKYSKSGHPRITWKCQCDCGNTIIVNGGDLTSGDTRSCGCLKQGKSSIEYKVNQYLDSHNINFKSQYKFDSLKGVHNGHLSYDFYLPNHNTLIECQGQQHEKSIEYFGGEEQFVIQQEHDKRKREYAEKNGYRFLEIWYYDYNNIENLLDKELST